MTLIVRMLIGASVVAMLAAGKWQQTCDLRLGT